MYGWVYNDGIEPVPPGLQAWESYVSQINNCSEYMMPLKPASRHWSIEDAHPHSITISQHTQPMSLSANFRNTRGWKCCLHLLAVQTLYHEITNISFFDSFPVQAEVQQCWSGWSFLSLNQLNSISVELNFCHKEENNRI